MCGLWDLFCLLLEHHQLKVFWIRKKEDLSHVMSLHALLWQKSPLCNVIFHNTITQLIKKKSLGQHKAQEDVMCITHYVCTKKNQQQQQQHQQKRKLRLKEIIIFFQCWQGDLPNVWKSTICYQAPTETSSDFLAYRV